MGKINEFLNSKIIKNDVGEETYLTWKETLSYALGRGAQGMNTSMTSSKYINKFLTDVLFKNLENPMGVAAKIRFFCGIFDAVNDPMMGIIMDRHTFKNGDKMRPYIRIAPILLSIVMILFFIGSSEMPNWINILYSTILFVMLDVTYTAFDIPMGALAFSITPSSVERTKLFGVSSIVRSIAGGLPQIFVAAGAWLPYFKDHTPQAFLTSAIISAIGIFFLTRLTYNNTVERAQHSEDNPSIKECFQLLFKNKPLLMLFLGNILFLLCKIPEQVSYYFVYDLMHNGKYNVFIDIVKFPGFLIAGICVPWIVEKLGEKSDSRKIYRVCCIVAICISVLFASSTFYGLLFKNPNDSVSPIIGILVVAFTGLGAIPLEIKNLVQKEMEAETVDYIEWKTGRRAEGTMLSIMSFTGKVENIFSSSLGLTILSWTGYKNHTDGSVAQNAQTNWALFIMTTIIPAVGFALMLIPMHFYTINAKTHKKMMAEIMERRDAMAQSREAVELAEENKEAQA